MRVQNSFLFIHMRTVSIADWPALLKQIYLYAAKLIAVLTKRESDLGGKASETRRLR